MFNKNFYPTPSSVIDVMLLGFDVNNKRILEPSAGKCDIVDYLKERGANVSACEINKDLAQIVKSRCDSFISYDFLEVKEYDVSHIDMIVMNPPFEYGEEHLLHAYEIAPDGCEIISLLNLSNLTNPYTKKRSQLKRVIETYGGFEDIGSCFSDSERPTNVSIALVKIFKPKKHEK